LAVIPALYALVKEWEMRRTARIAPVRQPPAVPPKTEAAAG
jgi:hypothetical protein